MSFVFSEVWNATFEGRPSDTENINLGAGRIRNLKVDISQRMQIDHQWAGNAFDGKHLRVTLPDGVSGSPDTGDGVVYAAGVSGVTELWYRDSAGHFIQLTSNGGLNIPSSFPVGTRLAFSNAAPPPGWIQVVGGQDRVIRLVDDSSGQGFGGGWFITGIGVSTSTTTLTSTTTSTTTSTGTSTSVSLSGGISVLGHTLTTAEIPPMSFSSDYPIFTGTLNASGSNSSSLITGTTTHSTNTVGSGGAHDHPVSNTLGASATSTSSSISSSSSTSISNSTSTSAADQNGAWRPPYINFCVGQKL
jgi:hypothetical protein